MQATKRLLNNVILAGGVLLFAGCASTNVNPSRAKPHTGYVDFYAPGEVDLAWDIKRWDPEANAFKPIFSSLEPPPGGVLRIESPPGEQRLQVTFLNRVIEAPLTVDARVNDGMVTPVRVELIPLSPTSVVRKEERFGPTAKGGYGRQTRFKLHSETLNRISALVQPPMAYRPKAQMPYGH